MIWPHTKLVKTPFNIENIGPAPVYCIYIYMEDEGALKYSAREAIVIVMSSAFICVQWSMLQLF